MIAKLTLAALCSLSFCVALRYEPARARTLLATQTSPGASLRLMTWNIGYAEMEDDTRAHTKDLKAVAETILSNDPDAVALQELTGDAQLKILLGHLRGRYRGATSKAEGTDRVEAVLVKDARARFEEVPGGEKSALAALFRARAGSTEIVLVSAHADAFSAARRRDYTERVVDWARARTPARIVFVAGDFNFELTAGDESHLYTDNVKHDSESYSYILKFFRDLGRDAGDTAINDRRIDYVFAPEEGVTLRRAEVLRGAVVGRMDHSPLLVEVSHL